MIGPSPVMALVRRELLSQLRHRRLFVLAAVLVGGTAWWVFEMLSEPWLSPDGDDIFLGLALVLSIFCWIHVPGVACISVVTERQRDTLDSLRMTGLRPRHIVLGKLTGAVGFYLLMLCAIQPLLSMLALALGVKIGVLLFYMGYLFGIAVTLGVIGVACGAHFQQPVAALFASYFLAFVVLFSFDFEVVSEFERGRSLLTDVAWSVLTVVDEYYPVSSALSPHFLYFVGLAVISALAFFWAVRALRSSRPMTDHDPKPVIDAIEILQARRGRFPYYLVDPLRRKPPLEDWHNPYVMRELRWGYLGRLPQMVRQFYASVLIFSIGFGSAIMVVPTRMADSIAPMFAVESVLLIVATILFSNNIFTKEAESGSLDFIRSALVPARGVFLGKFLAVIIALAPIFAAVAVTHVVFGILMASHERDHPRLALLASTVFLPTVVLYSLSLCFLVGVLVKTSMSSLVISAAVLFTVHCGFGLFAEPFQYARNPSYLVTPIFGFLGIMFDPLGDYGLLETGEFWAKWAVLNGIYLALSAIIFLSAGVLFHRRFLRAS